MVEMRMAREREVSEMLRTGEAAGQRQAGKKFWRKNWAEPKLFVATPPQQQMLERNEEVVFVPLQSRFLGLTMTSHLTIILGDPHPR